MTGIVYLVLCVSITSNNVILYLSIGIDLLGQSIGSSTFRLLLTETYWELCNVYLWICSSIPEVLTAEYKQMRNHNAVENTLHHQ